MIQSSLGRRSRNGLAHRVAGGGGGHVLSLFSRLPPHRPPSYSLRQSSRRCLEGRANNVPASSSASSVSAPILTPVMRRVSPEQAVSLCAYVNQRWADRHPDSLPSLGRSPRGWHKQLRRRNGGRPPWQGAERDMMGCCTHTLYPSQRRGEKAAPATCQACRLPTPPLVVNGHMVARRAAETIPLHPRDEPPGGGDPGGRQHARVSCLPTRAA